ncbi:MFS transporter [Actinophytocola gossypii]|uniref:MFS transporter n=1 Tax=Actinophytocola gossypii TaxID=2812003 RepID=A0ABT2JFC9_9PSEU|nr:MFS transporter [Actinophytocola gossypii]MCT2586421.1 MFS transporter [Actinophytocola gossypii]
MVASLLLVGFADETVAFLPYGAVESIRQDVGLSYLQAGFLLALYPGIGLLATPLGVVADHVSRRVMAAVGGVGYGVGLCLFAMAGDFWFLFTAVVVMGVAGDAMVRAVEVALVETTGDNVEPALARSNLLAAIGDLVGPLLLFAALGTGLGWRAAFWAAGALMVAYGLFLASQPLPSPAEPDDDHQPWRALLEVAKDRRVIVAGLLVAVISAFDDTFVGFAVAFLITGSGLTPAIATLAAGAGLAGGVAAAAWASRTKRRKVGLRPCAVLLLAGVLTLMFVPNVVAAALGIAAVGAAVNLAWIVLQARYLTLRPGQAGTTSAVAEAIAQLGVLTPLAIGVIADHHGLTVAMLLYVLLAAVFVASTRRQ